MPSTDDRMYIATASKAFKEAHKYAFEILKTAQDPRTRATALMHAFNASGRLKDVASMEHDYNQLRLLSFDLEPDSIQLWQIAALVSEFEYDPSDFQAYAGEADPQPTGDPPWETATPSSLDLDDDALKQLAKLCTASGADGHIVVFQGRIVSESYSPISRNPMSAMSSTKSIAAILIGILLDKGVLRSISDPVSRYIPSWSKGSRASITIEHLLTMTAGFDRIVDNNAVGYADDKNAHVISLEPSFKAGSKWCYSNEAVQVLAPIMEIAAGAPLQDIATNLLFSPLGLGDTFLRLDNAGNAMVYADMRTTLRDFARLGQLVLAKGRWQDKQLVSSTWITEMLLPRQKAWANIEYGYLWWLPSPDVVATSGYLFNNLYVFPDRGLVFARCQRMPHLHQTSEFNETEALRILRNALPR